MLIGGSAGLGEGLVRYNWLVGKLIINSKLKKKTPENQFSIPQGKECS